MKNISIAIWLTVATLWLICENAGAIVLVFSQGDRVLFENSCFKGYIRTDQGCFNITSLKGSGYATLFEGYADTAAGHERFQYMDGEANGNPKGQLETATIRQSSRVLEDGPIRGTVLYTLTGVYRTNSPLPGCELTMERRIMVYAKLPMITTIARFSLNPAAPPKTYVSYPNVMPYLNGNIGFRYIVSTALTGEVPDLAHTPDAKRTDWLNGKVEGGWLQFYAPAVTNTEKDISVVYLWPEKGSYRLTGSTLQRSNDKACKYRIFSVLQDWSGQRDVVFPLANVYAPYSKVGGDYLAKYYSDRYQADGTPRGIETSWQRSDKNSPTATLVINERSGLARTNLVLELDILAGIPESLADAKTGTPIDFQPGYHSNGQPAIIIQLPALQAQATLSLKAVLPKQ